MDTSQAIDVLSALSQGSRLDAFKLLVRHARDGLPAGEVARMLGVPQNTMSTHLALLQRAKLVQAERRGRSIIYRADLDRLRALMLFLVRDCCGADADLAGPLLADLSHFC